jgi:homoserine kinase
VVATWSGAGPSLLGICADRSLAARVAKEGERALEQAGVAGRALVAEADLEGLVVRA